MTDPRTATSPATNRERVDQPARPSQVQGTGRRSRENRGLWRLRGGDHSMGEKTMITVLVVLAVAAFLCAVFAAAVRPSVVPLWVSVLLLCIFALLQTLPVGRR